jgi:hypothetical protein
MMRLLAWKLAAPVDVTVSAGSTVSSLHPAPKAWVEAMVISETEQSGGGGLAGMSLKNQLKPSAVLPGVRIGAIFSPLVAQGQSLT